MDDSLLTGLWETREGPCYIWYDADGPTFDAKARELARSGWVLCSLAASIGKGGTSWTGVWEPGSVAQELAYGLSWNELLSRNAQLASRGLQLVRLSSHVGRRPGEWAGFWRAATPSSVLVGPVSWEEFWSAWLAQHAAGNRMIELDTAEIDGKRVWAGLWQPGDGDQFIWVGATWSAFSAKNEELRGDGYRLILTRSYSNGSDRRWAGVWRSSGNQASLVVDMNKEQFWTEWDRQMDRGFRLSRVNAWTGSEFGGTETVRVRLRLHIKILSDPDIPVSLMVDRMREVYEPVGLQVDVGSIEQLERPALVDVEVGSCSLSEITTEQHQLYAERNLAGDRDIVVYFVRSTLPPYNGCAAYPRGYPGAVVTKYATEWTLAHEVGHVLGLFHVPDSRRLMTGLGTANIVEPPPDLMPLEIQTMLSSELVTH